MSDAPPAPLLPTVSIVVPLFNEEATFSLLTERLRALLETFPERTEVVLVDDGSRDRTPLLMRELALAEPRFQALFLSRNFGHQLAVTAGLKVARGTRAVMIIDGDLQDPPELLTSLWERLEEGYEVVYAIRARRREGILLRCAYWAVYRIWRRFANIDLPADAGDFCLVSRRVVDCLNAMPEESRFLRGMRSWVGFRQIGVPYDRPARAAGETKYSFGRLVKLALNGLFNFSELPVRFASFAGLVCLLVGSVYVGWAVMKKIFFGATPEGFTGILGALILLSGAQLLFLGVLGEYILRIFFQVKQRPLFLIRDQVVDGTATGSAPDPARPASDARP